jgi:glycosyltransferase involved in cell wall biosynthesis
MSGEHLRIAMFSDSALPVLNGVSVSVNGLTQELRRLGHRVHLFAPRVAGYRESDPNTYRFRAIETPLSKGYPAAIPPYYRMLKRFRRHEFDIVHTHSPFFLGMVGLRWAESSELPIVSTYHTLYDRYAHYFKILPKRYVRFRIAKHTSFYYNHVDQVITPTDASLKWLRRHSVITPVSVIATGIPPNNMVDRHEARMQLGIAPEQRILLYVGRLAQEKNLSFLIESVAPMLRVDPTLRLWLVGDGNYRGECMALVRSLDIGDRVHFVGFVERARVDLYYAASDLFVFASTTETQGLVVQEAMTYGLPAVVVGGGGASAAMIDGVNGLVVRNETREFSHAVRRLLQNEDLYIRMSDAAGRTVREQSLPAMAEQVLSVYRKAIHGRSTTESPRSFASI